MEAILGEHGQASRSTERNRGREKLSGIMATTNTAENAQRMEAYLNRLRAHLDGFRKEEVDEIVDELRSHILDKIAVSEREVPGSGENALDAALAGLGTPEKLSGQYVTDRVLARAEASRSPLRILRNLFRWASLSTAGLILFLTTLIGYFCGIIFILVAIARVFHPHSAGLWSIPNGVDDHEISFRLGFGSPPAAGKDVLGWWIVPLGWMAGGGLIMLTTQIAVWFVRKYRKTTSLAKK
jgi:uncharacterized membrane protein